MPDLHIPDHVGREAVRLLNEDAYGTDCWTWPLNQASPVVTTVAKLLMDPPAPMTDPDEEAAKRVIAAGYAGGSTAAAEQIRKEFAARKEAWEAGRDG